MQMKTRTGHFSKQLAVEMNMLQPRLTQQELERQVGLSQSAVSQYLTGSRLPDAGAIHRLATRWPTENGGMQLLIAYLYDIIDSAGRPDEIRIVPFRDAQRAPPQLAHDLDVLRLAGTNLKNVRRLIHDVAELVSRIDIRRATAPLEKRCRRRPKVQSHGESHSEANGGEQSARGYGS
jgi:transcriptional regulator with XRE-family HTH domain